MPWSLRRRERRLADVDVVVVGAGCAGVTAAVSAARAGLRVLLVEREGTLGGISTGVLDTFYGFWTPGPDPEKVVAGLAGEIVERLTAAGAAFERPNTYGAGTGVTYNPEVLRGLYDQLAADAGVQVLFHTALVDVHAEGRRVEELLLVSGSELMSVATAHLIDCSGDAVVCHLAGAASEGWSDIPNPQSLTVTFTLAPVDSNRLSGVSRDELLDRLRRAAASGEYDLPRHDGSLHPTTVPGAQFVHMARVSGWDPRSPEQLSDAETAGRRQAREYARFLHDKVPGFEQAQMAWMARRIGVRESRRLRGRYWLTRDDVIGGRAFADGVVRAGAPIEDHGDGAGTRWEFLPGARTYEIPLRCLLPANLDNVAVAGRCLSASHDAHASARNMAQCMGMGQAVGTAAALAAQGGHDVADVDPATLRKTLIAQGALLGEP